MLTTNIYLHIFYNSDNYCHTHIHSHVFDRRDAHDYYIHTYLHLYNADNEYFYIVRDKHT